MDKAASAAGLIIPAILLGIGISAGRGDFSDIPIGDTPLVIAGGVAVFFAIFGAGYLACKAWDFLIERLRRQ